MSGACLACCLEPDCCGRRCCFPPKIATVSPTSCNLLMCQSLDLHANEHTNTVEYLNNTSIPNTPDQVHGHRSAFIQDTIVFKSKNECSSSFDTSPNYQLQRKMRSLARLTSANKIVVAAERGGIQLTKADTPQFGPSSISYGAMAKLVGYGVALL
jgi:hypothetical protein